MGQSNLYKLDVLLIDKKFVKLNSILMNNPFRIYLKLDKKKNLQNNSKQIFVMHLTSKEKILIYQDQKKDQSKSNLL